MMTGINDETKRQKAIKENFGFGYIRTDPEKEHFDVYKAINEILRHINQVSKKTLIG